MELSQVSPFISWGHDVRGSLDELSLDPASRVKHPASGEGGGQMSEGLMTYEDLAVRWKAPQTSLLERRRWVKRRLPILKLKPLAGFGQGTGVRFRPSDVERAEARAAGM